MYKIFVSLQYQPFACMNFKKLHEGITCNCLSDTNIDVDTPYLRRTSGEKPTLLDFKSWYELGKTSKDNCKDICEFRGVSIYICSNDTKETIIKKQKKIVNDRKRFAPMANIPEFGYLFTMKASAGRLKQSGSDNNHYDLYKCDEFSLDSLSHIEVINLVDV